MQTSVPQKIYIHALVTLPLFPVFTNAIQLTQATSPFKNLNSAFIETSLCINTSV